MLLVEAFLDVFVYRCGFRLIFFLFNCFFAHFVVLHLHANSDNEHQHTHYKWTQDNQHRPHCNQKTKTHTHALLTIRTDKNREN